MINSLEKLEIVKERGEAAQILGGWPLPPQAAKCVRTILRIEHTTINSLVKIKEKMYSNNRFVI